MAGVYLPSREIRCWLGQLNLRQMLFSPSDAPCTAQEAGVTWETGKSWGGRKKQLIKMKGFNFRTYAQTTFYHAVLQSIDSI